MNEYKELIYLIAAIIAGVIAGGFCGSFTLMFGIIRKKIWLGILGFVVCAILGAIMTSVFHGSALLSAIPAAIITVLIFLLSKKKT